MTNSPKLTPSVTSSPDFPALEEEILQFWKEQKLFEHSVDSRPSEKSGQNNEFVFYDGPPFANGLPHYGHLLTGFVKDLVARYQTMKGKKVERRFGWDCHGLPAEMAAEKELSVSGRAQITAFGIEKFNAHCRKSVMKYTHEWEEYVTRQARWVDFENDYKTMDTHYMESVMWAFKQLYEKGLVYEDMRVMPYSWACETPLSNFETRLDNAYRERADKAVTVAFTLNNKPHGAPEGCKAYKILAWTTTPWTLPSNLALAVGKDITYRCVVKENECFIIAASSIPAYRKELGLDDSKPMANAIFETDRLYARPYTEKDYDLLYSLHSDAEVTRKTIDGIQSPEQVMAYLKEYIDHQQEHGYSQWAVFEKGTDQFVGRAGLAFRSADASVPPQVEVRYALHQAFWGKGYATEAAAASVDWAFRNLDVEQVVACSSPDNGTSHRVLEKIGMHYVKNIHYREHDCVYYLVKREDFTAPGTVKGAALVGLSYEPLFPYFAGHKHAFQVLAGEFVLEGDGTGVVHMAPGFGEDDFNLCKANDIPLVCPVDSAGKFTKEVPDFEGLQVFDANDEIIKALKARGSWIRTDQYLHNYPHCWRTDTPLIYKALPSWYVEVTKFRDRMVELNQEINWIPGHVKDGLFGKWLEGARDWSISRNRFWGAPIPVWKSDDPNYPHIEVYGSIAELEKAFHVKVTDLHKPFIDSLTRANPTDPTGKSKMVRVPDVFDCWFESGSMPYAQAHYPFENKEWFEKHFPADFIVEYAAQTRGWFYTLMVLSTALFDRPPFLNCICHGVILDEKGQKLSKRLNNYADPKEIFAQYGADALRWLMVSSPVMRGQELLIDKEGKMVRDCLRLSIKPIWNAYHFFTLYANADGVKADWSTHSTQVIDRYILAKTGEAVRRVTEALDAYDTPLACQAIEHLFEVLNNWYIRRSRDRFWKTEKDADKQSAYNTLYTVLHAMCRAAAPLLPFTTEAIFKGLSGELSVHLADFPHASDFPVNEKLIQAMDRTRDVCNAALSIRNAENLRVRLPLATLTVAGKNVELLSDFEALIQDEVNVKQVKLSGDISAVASFKLQINFPVLGKRLPAKMKEVIAATKQGNWQKREDGQIEVAGEVLLPEECTLLLEAKEKKGTAPLSTNDALVVLNLHVSPELKQEGLARDVVRLVQQARKEADLQITDRIELTVDAAGELAEAVTAYQSYIAEQTLAVSVKVGAVANSNFMAEEEVEGEKLTIGVEKVG